ncbi:MAG: cytochrome bc complex cytochrome b subunit [Euryarchaeota archaeon]|nr:cytochrome bc complex cytochrome b subunit [Euryarchaeota archaeon]MDE1835801.1 cytochrome bc complex cytochrome b subunit [Euryarchaeota archaeon]MDE1880725.1 cytochrome bc complex cytochrome b subunit [Euryarchaeota archaeon]MDE2043992.1 cytochrome bc complex cytochrome b subunit [Thermoplasmata archaeon]
MTESAGTAPRRPSAAGPAVAEYRPPFNRTLDKIWDFIEVRVGTKKWGMRPQPDFTFNPAYWTGAFVANAFLIQVTTGLLLLFYYIPSYSSASPGGPPEAWSSTYYIIHGVPLGWLLLSAHLYGAYATIFLAFVHFFRGFYAGVYKPPRELSWMVGTLLLAAMLGMGFTGYLLPFTALSVGATDVGIALTMSVPGIGPPTAKLILGDGTYQGLLSRMFALHVVAIPLALAALLYAHISLFEIHGIAPKATSDPRAKRVFTHEDDAKMGRFFPKVFFYMTKWALFYAGLLVMMAAAWPVALAPPFGSSSASGSSPEPDWYFLWLYKLADFQYVSPFVAVGTVTAVIAFILFLPWIVQVFPFLDGGKKTHPRDRPVMLGVANFLAGFFILMTVWGGIMPGVVIPASFYALYLGTLAGVNALVIFVMYWMYRASYRARVAAKFGRRPLPGMAGAGRVLPSPVPSPSPAAVAVTSVHSAPLSGGAKASGEAPLHA